jgi:UDP-N-acetylglucosamine 2-epimerase (non-hydrolysing)
MRKYRVTIVSRSRPEIVKLAPVYRALVAQRRLEVHWIHTGQHGDRARDMLRCFNIVPYFQATRTDMTLEDFSGALTAFLVGAPVLHFAPTERTKAALLAQGVAPGRIVLTGSTVVDAQHWICARYGIVRDPAQAGHILVAAHRRDQWGSDMEQTFVAVADIATAHPQRRVLFPLHLNPLIGRQAQAILGRLPNVSLLPPLDYLAMQNALANADLLLTDSGDLQEEAPTFGVPTIVLRRETERPEAVEVGCALLVGPERADVVAAATRLLRDRSADYALRTAGNPFGDGRAAERIAVCIQRMLGIEEVLSNAQVDTVCPLNSSARRRLPVAASGRT